MARAIGFALALGLAVALFVGLWERQAVDANHAALERDEAMIGSLEKTVGIDNPPQHFAPEPYSFALPLGAGVAVAILVGGVGMARTRR